MVNAGKYTVHGWYRYWICPFLRFCRGGIGLLGDTSAPHPSSQRCSPADSVCKDMQSFRLLKGPLQLSGFLDSIMFDEGVTNLLDLTALSSHIHFISLRLG